MTFLELCKRVRQEAGVSGSGPATVVGQVGEMKRIVDWVNSAWEDVQLARPDWYWMRASFNFTTTLNDEQYSSTDVGIATRFSMWDINSFRIYDTTVGVNDQIELPFIRYTDYRDVYMTGPQVTSRPYEFTIAPNLDLLLGPKPNGTFRIDGDYYKSPQTLSADADIPELPSQFHMIIVYRALMLYARYEAAAEIYGDAEMNYRRLMRRLELNQMPDSYPAEPLV